MANEVPVASTLSASAFLPSGATRIAIAAVMDQNIACDSAIPTRLISNTSKLHANTDNTWLAIKTTNKPKSKILRSKRLKSSINGNDMAATIHAYSVNIQPGSAVVIEKSWAMSLNRATGTNSVVFIIKALTPIKNTWKY